MKTVPHIGQAEFYLRPVNPVRFNSENDSARNEVVLGRSLRVLAADSYAPLLMM